MKNSERPYAPKQFYIEYRYLNGQWVIQDSVDLRHNGQPSNLLTRASGIFEGFYFSVDGKKSTESKIELDYKHGC